MPLSITIILFFIGLCYLFFNNIKKAKVYLSISFIWLFLASYEPFSNYITKPLEQSYSSYLDIDKSIEYVLVLGSGHDTNEKLSSLSQLSQTAVTRLGEGVRIFRQLDEAKLIVSGYSGIDSTPHAIVSKKVAISLGVPKDKILTQSKAKDTFEEAVYAKKVIGNKKFVLVTSATHMKRAMNLFQAHGMNPIAAPTDFLVKVDGEFLSFPHPNQLRKTNVAIHEYLGLTYNKVIDFVKNITN